MTTSTAYEELTKPTPDWAKTSGQLQEEEPQSYEDIENVLHSPLEDTLFFCSPIFVRDYAAVAALGSIKAITVFLLINQEAKFQRDKKQAAKTGGWVHVPKGKKAAWGLNKEQWINGVRRLRDAGFIETKYKPGSSTFCRLKTELPKKGR